MSIPQYAPEGDMTIFEAAQLKERLAVLLANEGSAVLDLSGVKQVDASAIQLLIAAARSPRFVLSGMPHDLVEKCARLGWRPVRT